MTALAIEVAALGSSRASSERLQHPQPHHFAERRVNIDHAIAMTPTIFWLAEGDTYYRASWGWWRGEREEIKL